MEYLNLNKKLDNRGEKLYKSRSILKAKKVVGRQQENNGNWVLKFNPFLI